MKAVPNLLIYIHEKFHIFQSHLAIYLDLLSVLH
jgi:hypothetical protein